MLPCKAQGISITRVQPNQLRIIRDSNNGMTLPKDEFGSEGIGEEGGGEGCSGGGQGARCVPGEYKRK